MSSNGWVGFDLDGTLAQYDVWKGIDHIGDPVQPMIELVKKYISEGTKVKIFTARCCNGPDAINTIQDWCEKHGLPRLEVTNIKDYFMVCLYDDRAVGVEKNTGRIFNSIK